MDFTVRTKNEPQFRETLQEIVDENGLQYPNAITIHRDTGTGVSIYVLTDLFINRLSPDSLRRLKSIN